MFNHNKHSTAEASPFTKYLVSEDPDLAEILALAAGTTGALGTVVLGTVDPFVGDTQGIQEAALNYLAGGATLGLGAGVGGAIGGLGEFYGSPTPTDVDQVSNFDIPTIKDKTGKYVPDMSKRLVNPNRMKRALTIGAGTGAAVASLPAMFWMNDSIQQEKKELAAQALEAYNNIQ